MRGLFFKIFAIFWIAQSLIFVISTALIVRQRFVTPNLTFDALDTNLRNNAERAFRAYDGGGCVNFINESSQLGSSTMLLNESGAALCSTPDAPSIAELDLSFPKRISGRQVGPRYVWTVPVRSGSGKQYQYLWFQPHTEPRRPRRSVEFLHFAFPQLPVAIAVGGATTFVLVLLFTRPLVRLRGAARQLAKGNLSARVETSSNPSKSEADEFQGLVHDFNHMAERLESLVGAQRLLLRDVSHELRSPLTRLSVALELAREDNGHASNVHLNRIERETEKLNELIGQLLTLSSIETRENTSTFEPVSLNQICEQILPDAEYEAKQRLCTVILEQAEECVILGDWGLLHRAIENVVRNAIRYTNEKTQVTIRLSRKDQSAVVEVIDCGPGIPEAELTHIFRPFYRVDQARSFSTGGFGVGLAITERAVKLHGGSLHAANLQTGGASVCMEFPAIEAL